MGGKIVRRCVGAGTLLAALPLVLPASAAAEGSGTVRTSHRETVLACRYAARHDRVRAVRRCRRVASARVRATASATTYQNPVYGSAPDPMAVATGSDYYAYHTGGNF